MITQELLNKYFKGECTAAEEALVARWLQQADLPELRKHMEAGWEQEGGLPAGEALKQQLAADLRRQLYPPQQKRPVYKIWLRLAIPAAAALLALLWYWTGSLPRPQENSLSAMRPTWDTVVNTTTGKRHFTLPDSTRVWLSPASRLIHSIAAEKRLVQLIGQAFFEVAPDAARPFSVLTGNVETQVLGTAFNIEAYQGERSIRVSLVSGKVALFRKNAPPGAAPLSHLEKGQAATCSSTGLLVSKDTLRLTAPADWTSQATVFDNVPVQDALERIAAQYGITIQYHKGVNFGSKRFSTVFDRETPEQMVRNILFIADCRYKLEAGKLVVLP
ncbi:FecR domain-containing protein [Chitinophaga sp.]|uniref:FecR family protein n=1 Tax=Chitinophaga sp. TaxID=1869181 RepID=UPI0031CED44B